MSSLSAVFVGSDTLLLQCVEEWRAQGHEVAMVVTDAPRIAAHCADIDAPCAVAQADLGAQLAGVSCDYLFAVTWFKLLPESVLRVPRVAAVNFHDGPLPRYAGLNATCWALLNGEAEHAVTWHVIQPQTDGGDVLVQSSFAIGADDTAFTLNARCFDHGLQSFAELGRLLATGRAQRSPQDVAMRTYFGRDRVPDALGVLDVHGDVDEVVRVVRALDHGGYPNQLTAAKLRVPSGFVALRRVERLPPSGAAPGTVTAVDAVGVQVACAGGDVRFEGIVSLDGAALSNDARELLGLVVGASLPAVAAAQRAQWVALGAAAARAEHEWLADLARCAPLPIPGGRPSGAALRVDELPLDAAGADELGATALAVAFLLRDAGARIADIGYWDAAARDLASSADGLAMVCPPTRFALVENATVQQALESIVAAFSVASVRGPLLSELPARRHDVVKDPESVKAPVRVTRGVELPVTPGTMTVAVDAEGAAVLRYDAAALDRADAEALAARFAVFARAASRDPDQELSATPLLDSEELERLLYAWNDTAAGSASEPCMHRQFAAAAAAHGDRVALRCGGHERTYAALAEEIEQLAGLLHARGVRAGDRVGVCTQRGFGMVTAALAAQRCGAAYVPLDPDYPRDRVAFMATDAELAALVVDGAGAAAAPEVPCPIIDLEADRAAIAAAAPPVEDPATGDDLAYMIYTSGSTGRPKGVMVRHRNVTNFFVGMDGLLGGEAAGTWLAVTSLSFDISVLELFWTLCRGFTVVIHRDVTAASAAPSASRAISFSMFYFASDEGEHSEDKYRLLIEGAKFADQNGFEAVWTPERHFHAFGGLYPNPAVTGAALATITENVKIRAGSCVAPLHHPVRIAEDWALVDNLSRGRVGIAFAAGWHGRDFVLRPENFEDRKGALIRTMEQVHALWRGEELEFEGHDGAKHKVRTLPRPVQEDLPTWVTVAGNPETYRLAGASGSHVLTHLLGQSLEELDKKLDIYRQAWRDSGREGDGHVTLMLHTFVGEDADEVRELVREPMKGYLRSSLDLVKQAAWSFPAFKNRVDEPGEMDALLNGGLTPEDFDALLDFSFERYYQQSGLFGTPESCVAIVDRLRALQVDEIACLIDFGVPTADVMASLPHLNELKRRCDERSAAGVALQAEDAATIPALIERHGVTHFQCTPSMASMLLHDPAALGAFGRLEHMFVGGEALSKELAGRLRGAARQLHDVYGPTETTVWSTAWTVGDEDPVPIGRPLANQQVYVLDPNRQPVATGDVGELWVGGDGVTAGYFKRPDLTEQRFRPDPFRAVDGARIYPTGDRVRWRADGVREYLGRRDTQVKVRGYRIELGEVEAALTLHPDVAEAVVVARGDGEDARLVAYVVQAGAAPAADELRAQLRAALPEFMVPSAFVALSELPRTPNMKVDRKALPEPGAVAAPAPRELAAAADDTEAAILAIWRESLGTDDVGVEDNFFDSGGHSILAVKVHRAVTQRLDVDLAVTDLFRFTTVRALAAHLRAGASAPTAAQQASARAKARRNILRRR
ncbi:MAG: MupA/Atu3671 family FMN-dependent luciferase-like monooxygenase [Planctomycetota bacterium]|nr:MupA/Atu3671 family FMN-dependent luciferase-like monooxygenase [Planctomycetota bacterium]